MPGIFDFVRGLFSGESADESSVDAAENESAETALPKLVATSRMLTILAKEGNFQLEEVKTRREADFSPVNGVGPFSEPEEVSRVQREIKIPLTLRFYAVNEIYNKMTKFIELYEETMSNQPGIGSVESYALKQVSLAEIQNKKAKALHDEAMKSINPMSIEALKGTLNHVETKVTSSPVMANSYTETNAEMAERKSLLDDAQKARMNSLLGDITGFDKETELNHEPTLEDAFMELLRAMTEMLNPELSTRPASPTPSDNSIESGDTEPYDPSDEELTSSLSASM